MISWCPWSSSDERTVQRKVRYTKRLTTTITTKRFHLTSGKSVVYSYASRSSDDYGREINLSDFDGGNYRQVNWDNVEAVDPIETTEAAYTVERSEWVDESNLGKYVDDDVIVDFEITERRVKHD